ncbi:MAG: serine hydrolase [Crocinitomicaceae bacterium]|nr:serine hydrolase [Crocinitomicaceae bacterium]
MIIISFFCLFATLSSAQTYFPPNNSNAWDSLSPASLNWCQNKIDSLFSFLNTNYTKSFILLKDGKIVLEKYFNGHSDTSSWYWASAGKTISSFLVGMAQEEGYLQITDTTSNYLGYGWTDADSLQEQKITIWNQLTMTTGLNDNVLDLNCTNDTCLKYLSDPGLRWAYHNAPYTLLRPVLENATGQGVNLYNYQKLLNPIGMNGFFLYNGFDNVFYSTSRSMARFGLLILNNGKWDGNQIMTDTNYFNQMLNTSQMLNESYGYLWWLNGKSTNMIPGSQFVFNNELIPNAPSDLVAALGKNGQIINVVPSQNLVWIRMGENPDNFLIPNAFNIEVWNYINDLECGSLGLEDSKELQLRKLVKVVDITGRVSEEKKNTLLFYLYEDGTVEKRIIIE